LPGALGIAAEAMSVTKSELLKMMEQGKLMSEDFLPKFAKQLSQTYGSEALKKTDSLQANLNRLNNRWIEFKAAIGGALAPLLNTVLKKLMSLMDSIKPLADQIQGIFEGIRFPDINPMPALRALLSSVKSQVNYTFGLFKAMYNAVYPLFEKIAVSVFSVLPDVQGLFADILKAIEPVAKFLREILDSIAQSVDLSGILKTTFEILRSVVQSLYNVFKVLFEVLTPILKPILSAAFKALGDSIKVVLSIVKELAGWLKMVTDKIQQATSWVKKKLGLDKGIKEKTEEGTPSEIILAQPEQAKKTAAEEVFGGGSADKNASFFSGQKSGNEMENTTKEILSGGSKPTHITVNISKFQDYIQITTNNLNQATQDIQQQLEEMLLRVVNGVNQVTK